MALKDKSRRLRKQTTNSEKILWDKLRAHRFHGLHFRRQYPIGNRFILDFYCASLKLGIEIDGEIHDNTENKANDKLRTEALEQKLIRILRFKNSQITEDLHGVLNEITAQVPPLHVSGEGLRGRGKNPAQSRDHKK